MKNMKCDVAVVAGGPAGLAAALSSAQKGAKVILLEKASTTGGAANMGMGPFAVESRLQKGRQIALTKDEAFKIFMDYTHWRVDARLVRAYIDKSADTIDWLEKMGVEFCEPSTYFPGGQYTWHIVKPAVGKPGPMAAATMTKIMTEKAREIGVQILLQTPAKKLIRHDGHVAGVMAEDQSGEQIQIDAKAVIIATGGFGDSPEMIKKYTGYEWGKDFFSVRIPGLVGDGIRMAWEAGAAPSEMNVELIYGIPDLMDPVLMILFHQPDLMVNLDGDRFINEQVLSNTTFTGNAVARQKNKCAFTILDSAIISHYESKGFDFPASLAPDLPAENLEGAIHRAIDGGNKHIYVAESLEELAEKTGIDPEGLRVGIDEYNECCERGYDPVFNKDRKYLRKIEGPKYYAARNLPGGYGSLGGVKINHRTEVIDKNGKKIDGLYAAGTDANSIYGDSYVFVLPGNTMGFALNSGRIAGENAADYIV